MNHIALACGHRFFYDVLVVIIILFLVYLLAFESKAVTSGLIIVLKFRIGAGANNRGSGLG